MLVFIFLRIIYLIVTEIQIFYFLVHSLNGLNSMGGAWVEPGVSSLSSTWAVAGPQALGLFSAFLGTLSGTWNGSEAARTKTSAPTGSYCCS